MPIYTKTGDKGTTSLFGGKRLSKSDIQIDTYGSIDELSSFIGLIISHLNRQQAEEKQYKELLLTIQKELYEVMGVLAGAKTDIASLEYSITIFEKTIDEIQGKLPKLNRFILPGGNELAAIVHIARTVCRRAERRTVNLYNEQASHEEESESISLIMKYLNRLSDLLFVLARWYGKDNEIIT